MNYYEKKELRELKGEINATASAGRAIKYKISRDLLGGQGEKMIETLKNPPKPPQPKEKKKSIWENIKKMFSND